jgi:8-oxo-dGTP pyrophosphatase MutT (NUDIX family)
VRRALVDAPAPATMPRRDDDGRASAVLAALHGGRGDAALDAHVVLTRRALHLRHHAGEVSFPGGRQEPGEDLWGTALREATEEVALDPGSVTLLGELDHLRTVTSESFIVPFVAELPDWPALRRDPGEVDAVLHVPLADLLHPEAYREERWTFGGQERSLYFFDIVGDTIWGATAAMLRNLLTIVTGTFDEAHRQPPWTIPRPDTE